MSTRRDFLLTVGAGAVAHSIVGDARTAIDAAASRLAPSRASLSGVGVQLYMLRAPMRADAEGTLARIAGIGYSEIEWWGQWQRTSTQLRAMLDANGLRAPAAHIEPRDLAPERLDALLESASIMGHRTLLVAWTAPDQRKTADDWKRTAALLSSAGATAAKAGIRTGYHNHDFEFQSFGDRSALDILIGESDPAFVDFELDCYWAYKAGHEPLALLNRHKDRITLLHLKDSAGAPEHAQRDIGSGVIDWSAVMRTALAARVTNVFVEMDDPADAWASARSGRAYLRTLGY